MKEGGGVSCSNGPPAPSIGRRSNRGLGGRVRASNFVLQSAISHSLTLCVHMQYKDIFGVCSVQKLGTSWRFSQQMVCVCACVRKVSNSAANANVISLVQRTK